MAIGIDITGRKLVLGLRQGATENAVVVGALLGELMERGLDFSTPRLYILRWVGSALLFAESRWNRIHGYRHLPMLVNALNAAHQLRCAHNQAALKAQVSAA